MRRLTVEVLARADAALDEVLYRPAVVQAFRWLPRWWRCDLARLSVALDRRWDTGHWAEAVPPHGVCAVCRRRAAVHEYGAASDGPPWPLATCGWCRLDGPMRTPAERDAAIDRARRASVAWRWRAD